VTRILAVADEVHEALYGGLLQQISPDLILACGDLPFDYLDNLVSRSDRPLVYVLGNHDTAAREGAGEDVALVPDRVPSSPAGGISAEGRIVRVAGVTVAGLGGSLRYKPGPNQYSQNQMRRRALSVELRARLRRALRGDGIDILLTHAAPLGVGDGLDPAHRGFVAFHRLLHTLRPRFLVHGHVHPRVPPPAADEWLGGTHIVNAVPYRVLELDP
jgi:Icc-related predicted phosphoesterase